MSNDATGAVRDHAQQRATIEPALASSTPEHPRLRAQDGGLPDQVRGCAQIKIDNVSLVGEGSPKPETSLPAPSA